MYRFNFLELYLRYVSSVIPNYQPQALNCNHEGPIFPQLFRGRSQDVDLKLTALRDEMAADLYELEEDYYSSIYKDNANTK